MPEAVGINRTTVAHAVLKLIIFLNHAGAHILGLAVKLLSLLWPKAWRGHRTPRECEHAQNHKLGARKATVVSIVVAESCGDRIDSQKLASMLQWCFMNKMHYVFLFDPAGEELYSIRML